MTRSLVLLHGFTGSPQSFARVRQLLPAHIDVVAPTLLGHDGSAPPVGAPDTGSFEREVDRLLEFCRPSHSQQCFVCGYSLGARLALGLLARHSRWFRGALLIGVHPGLTDAATRAERIQADERWCRMLEAGDIAAFADAWQCQPLFGTQASLSEELLVEQRRTRLGHHPLGLAAALRHLGLGRMPDYRSALTALRIPATLMVGELDAKCFGLCADIAKVSPAVSLLRVAGTGHNIVLERPERVARALLEGIGA
jgi:2-succinyl-6-hydroxy-2,4-cyclohexadiene-1-carboxylate synthase